MMHPEEVSTHGMGRWTDDVHEASNLRAYANEPSGLPEICTLLEVCSGDVTCNVA